MKAPMVKYFIEVSALFLVYFFESRFPLFKKSGARAHQAAANLVLYFINLCILYAALSALLVWEVDWTHLHSIGLLHRFEAPEWSKFLAAFLLYDLWMYLIHRTFHAVPFLWRFHRTHHTDDHVDVSTAFRFHVGEQLISAVLLRLLIVPVLGLSVSQVLLYEICSRPVVLFHHGNLSWPEKWDRLMRSVFVSPNMHRVHHSQILSETNSNYSSLFSFWDRLAGTFRLRKELTTVRYGLPEFPGPYWQSLPGLLKTPLAPTRPEKAS